MEGNQYFENQMANFLRSISDDELVKRSKECQYVLDHIEEDKVWQTVLEDCRQWVKQINANWQDCYDENKLSQMRVLKHAYNHIFSLPEKYKQEYKYVLEEIDKRQSPKNILKDYDTDTNLEN